jgi:F-type H+-transporting ATPase subunit gamma
VVLVSSKLISMMSQKPETRKLVPITNEDLATLGGSNEAPSPASRGTVEFAGSPEFVLSRLLPKYLEFTIFSAMLETDAAFFAAQLLAMTNATDNASKLIDELTIAMNNARQAAITKELLEIVAGAEALGVE